jgi:hypothetical protein
MKKQSTIGAVLLMILGFKADLNKYYQSKVVKKVSKTMSLGKSKRMCAKFNISFTQERKNELIFEEKRIQYLLIKPFKLKNKLVTKKQYENMF